MVGIVVLGICVLMGGWVIRKAFCVVEVEMGSMMPTLSPQDRVLVFRYWPARWLRRKQIVIVAPTNKQIPLEPSHNIFGVIPCIKRVTALPGDHFSTQLTELSDYHRYKLRDQHDNRGRREWHIPPQYFFVRGDNPKSDYDSMVWGPLPYSSLLGVVILKLPANDQKLAEIVGSTDHSTSKDIGLSVGSQAPNFEVISLDGQKKEMNDYRGRTVAIIFIKPGHLGGKVLEELLASRQTAERAGVSILIVLDTTLDLAQQWVGASSLPLNQFHLTVSILPGKIQEEYRVENTVAFCLVDHNGLVQATGYPYIDYPGWKNLVECWVGK